MSNLNYAAINEAYPIAGQDNDSEGFRGNFAAIKASLTTAQTDLTELQLKSVLKQTLGNTAAATNDLLGSTVKNGLYSNLNGVVPDAGQTVFTGNQYTVRFSGNSENAAPFQVFRISQNSLITFANWRISPVQYTRVRYHFVSDGGGAWTVQFSNTGGVVIFETGSGITSQTITLTDYTPGSTSPVHTVVDVWTYNGTTVFVKIIGNYAIPL